MDVQRKVEICKILNEYRGKKLVMGKRDCNLLILKIYEPHIYDLIYGEYDEPIKGSAIAFDRVGHRSIKALCEENYHRIDSGDERPYDIVVFNDTDVGIWTVHGCFGVVDDKFDYFKIPDDTEYKVFCKG